MSISSSKSYFSAIALSILVVITVFHEDVGASKGSQPCTCTNTKGLREVMKDVLAPETNEITGVQLCGHELNKLDKKNDCSPNDIIKCYFDGQDAPVDKPRIVHTKVEVSSSKKGSKVQKEKSCACQTSSENKDERICV